MFQRFFRKNQSLAAAEALYAAAADQARAPVFYENMGVPDNVEGRFEMTALHVWLVLRRLRGEDPALRKCAQALFDAMFASFDDALRELGVGDLVVGKKIRKLAENFYGRVEAYDSALQNTAGDALAAALARNVLGSDEPASGRALEVYVRASSAHIDGLPLDEILTGAVSFAQVQQP